MLVVAPEIAKGAHKSSRRKSPSVQVSAPKLMFALASQALVAILVIADVPVAHAQSAATNAGFETGDLTGWTAGGGTGTQSSSAYSSSGVGVSVVTGMTSFDSTAGSEPGEYSWTVDPYGSYMASLQATDTLSSGNSFATAMTALGLSSSSSSAISSSLGGTVTNAAWITQSLNLTAGQTITMAWQYISTDYEPFNDGSITSLVNETDPSNLASVNNETAQYALLGATNTGTGNYATGSYGATGWEISTYTVSETGTYLLGFASFNLSDEVNSPILFVDQQPGTTYNNGVLFNPIQPNAGSSAPTTPPASIVIDTAQPYYGSSTLGSASSATFDGGTLKIDQTDPTITQDFSIDATNGIIDQAGQNSVFSGTISDATDGTPGALTITNSGDGGSVTLSGDNTYSGGTTITGGSTVMISSANNLGSGAVTLDNGTLTMTAGMTDDHDYALASGGGTIDVDGNNVTLQGGVSGSGSLTLANSGSGGALTLAGTNTYTGATNINSGATLALSGVSSIAGSSDVTNNGTFDISGADGAESITSLGGDGTVNLGSNNLALTNASDNFSGSIQGIGGIAVDGGTETLSGINTYDGGTSLNGGTLQVSSDGNMGDISGWLSFNGGTLENTASFTTARNINLLGDANFNTDAGTTLTDTAGAITGSGSINKLGAGTLILGADDATGGVNVNAGSLQLTQASTYSGATNVASGATLALTGNGSIANSSVVNDNGTFDISNANGAVNVSTLSGSGSVLLGNNNLALTNANGTFSGTIAGNGGLAVDYGSETLTGANTYTGDTTLNGGTLQVSADDNLGASSGALDFNGGTLENTASFTTARNINLLGDANFNTDAGTTLTDTAGAITGSGSINKLGAGTLILGADDATGGVNVNAGSLQLTQASTYSGATNVASGTTLALTGNGSIANSSVVNDNGMFDISGAGQDETIASLAGSSTGTVNLGGRNLNLTNADDNFAGSIQGTGSLSVTSGTETLSGSNSYLGATTIGNGATLALSGSGSLSSDALSAGVVDNGTFDISNASGTENVSTLSGSGTVSLGNNSLALTNASGTFSGSIAGNGGVVVDYGPETLTGASTYTGGTDIQGGSLIVNADNNLGAASGSLTFGNAELENTASFTSTRDINVIGTANFNTDTGTTLTDTAGAITGAGDINKLGNGTLVLGAIDTTGNVGVSAGTLQVTGQSTYSGWNSIASGATLALTGNGSIANSSVDAEGTFDVSGANGSQSIAGLLGSGTVNLGSNNLTLTNTDYQFAGTINGTGGIAVDGGVEELSGNNTYSGGTTIQNAALLVSSDANLGDASGGLTFNGGVLESTATLTTTRDIAMDGAATFNVDSGTTLTDIAGQITGSGPIEKEGTGTLVLGADHSTGGVIVGQGTLQLTGASTDTDGVNVANGATLALTGNGSIAAASGVQNDGTLDISGVNGGASITTLSGAGTVNLGNNGLSLTNANGIYSGTINGNGGVTLDNGVEELSGNNSYTGGTTLTGGTLMVSSDANLGDANGALNFNGGTLENTASFTTTRNVNASGAVNIDTDAGTTLTDTAGTITGNGPITKLGAGTLVLGADNSSGGLNVGAGTVQLTGASTDTGATQIASGATLAITGNGSDASASSIDNSGTFDISGANNAQSIASLAGNGSVNLGNNGLTLTNANGNFSGTIGGSGGVTLNGGTEELSGANTYTGGTTLNGGTLAVSSDANLGDASGALNFNGGTLESTASFTTTRNVNATGAVNIDTDAGTTLTDAAGAITGNGPITKLGAGTLVLGADNSTGGLNVGGGTLQLTGASADAGAVNIATGATLAVTGNGSEASASSINNSGTFDVSGANGAQSIVSLAGNGTVNLGNNGLTLTNANGNFGGNINGQGGVTLSGGTEVLGGNNSYTGGTTLNGGNLVVSSDANLGASGTPVTFNGGTLTVTQSMNTSRNLVIDNGGADFNTLTGVTVTDSGNISGAGGLVKTGAGTLIVSGDNTFTGGTLIDGGVVQIDTGSSLGAGTILLNGGTLQTTASLNNNQNVVVSGNAGVNVDAGTTTVMAGDIEEASGSGCFVKSGTGTLNLTGRAVLANGTCVQNGMLRANGDLVSNVTVDAPGELRGVGVIEGPIDVSGRLAPGNSPGTLTVTGTVTMHAGSTYEEDIDGLGTGTGAGNYSRLILTGANSQFVADGTLVPLLRGITGNASNTYTPTVGDVYQIVVAQGGIVGQFSALTQPAGLAPNTRLVAFYNVNDNHSIELGVLPTSYAGLLATSGANRNALSAAYALDQAVNLQAGGTASSGQSELLYAIADAKADQLGSVMTALAGEVYADEAAAARADGLAIQSDTLGHLSTDDSDVAGEQSGHLAWANVSHDGNRWSGDAQASGFQTGTNQTSVGTDVYAGYGTVVGLAASNHDTTVNAGLAQGSIRGNSGIVYGQQAIASVLVDGVVSYGHDTWITRRPDPTGAAGSLYSRTGGNDTMADLTARMPISLSSLHIEPYASVIWQQFERGSMSETGSSPAALQVSGLSATGTRALLGVNIGSNQQSPLSSEVTYRLGAALGRDSRGLLSPDVQSTLEGESFDTRSADIGRNFVQLNANGTIRLSHSAYLYGGVTDELGTRRSSYGVTAGLRVSF
ncbi:hypothetical protein GCM10027066_04580 [Dyella jejuensis]